MSKQQVFWICQLSGWFLVGLINYLVQSVSPSFDWLGDLLASLLLATTGIFFTLGLRKAYQGLNIVAKKPVAMILPILSLSLVCAIVTVATGFMIIEFVTLLQGTRLDMFTFNNWLGNLIAIYPLVLIWSSIYLAVQYLMRWRQSELDKAQLESALKDAQLNTLMGQINPHFMFNSLNNIRGLMLEDVERARDMLTLLSKVIRYSLTAPKKERIPLNEELEIVDAFLQLAKIQLEERLVIDKQIAAGLEQCLIPPMLLQMLVENAIKHGISEVRGGGTLSIAIRKQAQQLVIEVCNPGDLNHSSATQQSTNLGVENIRQRLALLYSGQAEFSLHQQGEKVHAEVRLPL